MIQKLFEVKRIHFKKTYYVLAENRNVVIEGIKRAGLSEKSFLVEEVTLVEILEFEAILENK